MSTRFCHLLGKLQLQLLTRTQIVDALELYADSKRGENRSYERVTSILTGA